MADNSKLQFEFTAIGTTTNNDEITKNNNWWILDSGTTSHMTGSQEFVTNYQEFKKLYYVTTAAGDKMRICGKGNVNLQIKQDNEKIIKIKLLNVLYVPLIVKNIISVSKITDAGLMVKLNRSGCSIIGEHIELKTQRTGNLYMLINSLEETANQIVHEYATEKGSENKKVSLIDTHLELQIVESIQSSHSDQLLDQEDDKSSKKILDKGSSNITNTTKIKDTKIETSTKLLESPKIMNPHIEEIEKSNETIGSYAPITEGCMYYNCTAIDTIKPNSRLKIVSPSTDISVLSIPKRSDDKKGAVGELKINKERKIVKAKDTEVKQKPKAKNSNNATELKNRKRTKPKASTYKTINKIRSPKVTNVENANKLKISEKLKTTSGHCQFLGGELGQWGTRIHGSETIYTTVSEYLALSLTMQAIKWLCSLLVVFCIYFKSSIVMWNGQSAIERARKKGIAQRNGHMDIGLHSIKDMINKTAVTVKYCTTDQMKADVLKKPFLKMPFNKMRKKLGIIENDSNHSSSFNLCDYGGDVVSNHIFYTQNSNISVNRV